MAHIPKKVLIDFARSHPKLFPNTKINSRTKLNEYQVIKISRAIKAEEKENKLRHARLVKKRNKQKKLRANGSVFYPDKPLHYQKAGFYRVKDKVYSANEHIKIYETYKSEGKYSYYAANFYGGKCYAQLLPLTDLPEYLEELINIEEEEGQFYDKITLREGDSDFYQRKFNSAEELYLWLTQYKRHGALVGEGGSFKYIQVCFLTFMTGE